MFLRVLRCFSAEPLASPCFEVHAITMPERVCLTNGVLRPRRGCLIMIAATVCSAGALGECAVRIVIRAAFMLVLCRQIRTLR